MRFDTMIIGCGAATPTLRHKPSSQLVNIHERLFLVDCGEGTQMELRRYRIRFQRIDHIFISHLHGDHYLGLMGYMSSLHLLGRQNDLHVYGPPELKMLIEVNLRASQTYLSYRYVFHELDFSGPRQIFEDDQVEIMSFPLKHRIECCGFMFREKPRQRRIPKETVVSLALRGEEVVQLKRGLDIERPDGSVIRSVDVTEPPLPPRSFAYCSDTAYDERIVPWISGATLLYHESTFLEKEAERAKDTFHSTAIQAATIARMADVGTLLIGHYSSRYDSEAEFLTEATTVFPHTRLAMEGDVVEVLHP